MHRAGRRDGDVSEPHTWEQYPDAEVVIHLAASSFVPLSWTVPWKTIRDNVLGTTAALDYCRTRGAKLVFLSSYLYGNPTRLPIAEDAAAKASNPYGLSKKLAEDACAFYGEHFGVSATILRPFNVYGVGQGDDFLIPTILRQLKNSSEVRVKDLAPRRDYVYVDDVTGAIASAAAPGAPSGIFNIGSGHSHSVADLVEIMQQIWGTALPVLSEGERRKGEIMDTVADISKSATLLGWVPSFDLRGGLENMYIRAELG